MKNWIKLEQGNDWGTVYYTLPGKRLTNGVADRRYGIPLKAGMELDVRTPDGQEGKLTLVRYEEQTSVSDHGKSYGCTQEYYGFNLSAMGVEVFVPITALEVLEEQMPAPRGPRH